MKKRKTYYSMLGLGLTLCGLGLVNMGCANSAVAEEVSEPQKYVKVDTKKKPKDKEWIARDTRTVDMLPGFTPYQTKVELDAFGGRKDRMEKATGFFYPKKVDGRWWLVDPEGSLFIHTAIVGVYPGLSEYTQEKALKQFGSLEKWADFSANLLDQYGFTGSGGWSWTEPLRKTTNPPVYTLSWDFMADFAKEMEISWQVSGHFGYPENVWPVFHPNFKAYCDEYAKKVIATKDDPYCIGHFSDNELQLKDDMLARTLKMDLEKYPEMKYNVAEAKRWLADRKGKAAGVDDITKEDSAEFIAHMFDRYYSLTSVAIRKYDPNHLCLGSRLHGGATRKPLVLRVAGKYLDVVSVNYYNKWEPNVEQTDMWVKESGRPFMITEWYAKGHDSGLPNNSGAGWLVKTQADRAKFYQHFSLGLMETKNCVGWHWFKLKDNDPTDLSVDASNRDSNKGIVTHDFKPYTEVLEPMKQLNDNVYPLLDYFDKK